jgi:hypothetical protein
MKKLIKILKSLVYYLFILQIMDLKNFSISFDVYGKMYFSSNNYEYQVNIDKNNNLIFEKDNYQIIDKYDKPIYQLQNLDETSLKQKINEEDEEKEKEKEKEDEYNSDDVETEEDYYPEDNDYVIINEPTYSETIHELDDTLYDYGEHNVKFDFWSPGVTGQIKINYKKNGDIMALYDTYIYDINNQLIFKSNSSDDSSIYRIKVYPTGDILFRPIGNIEKKYNLKVGVNELVLKSCF